MTSRCDDTGLLIESFLDEVLVHCPRCNACAKVFRKFKGKQKQDIGLRCGSCGHHQAVKGIYGWIRSEPRDWFFSQPLWLQTPCCNNTLWAFNLDHLTFLHRYISAGQRMKISDERANQIGFRNMSLASSLPQWMITAKNRHKVLAAIERLRALAVE